MSTSAAESSTFDIAICGGGLVGASLALAIAQLGLTGVLIEASPFGAAGQPSFDDRSTALSNGSRRVFEALDVWPLIEREATAIKRIHVSDQGRFGFARINAADQGLNALGYVVTNRVMGAALWQKLLRSSVQVLAPARVIAMELQQSLRVVRYVADDEVERSVSARLVVAADGARSQAREAAGIPAQTWDYEQVALVTNVFTQRFHEHIAYERFTQSGPIALLPMSDGRMGLIWTFAPDVADSMSACSDADFLRQLQDSFGFRLGRFTRVGARQFYPLSLTRSDDHVAERLAIVGNAAQALHPIAGQGFNLGLRDAASLAEVLADAQAQSAAGFDPGDGLWLQYYAQWRSDDRSNIVRFTDGLVRVFSQPFGPVKLLRDIGLLAFDLMPLAKDALAQLSLGAAGKVPRLARGAPLRNL
jgi:2-octaprenyl-6-methoxyphenol hydroxylase